MGMFTNSGSGGQPSMGFGMPAGGYGANPMDQQVDPNQQALTQDQSQFTETLLPGNQAAPQTGQQPGGQPQMGFGMPAGGYGGGKIGSAAPMGFDGAQMGFGMPSQGYAPAPAQQPNVQMGFGMPPSGGFNSALRTQMPMSAPRTGIPGQQAQPNQFTRNRLR